MKHKGHAGSVEFSAEDECWHGRVQGIDDLITYEGRTVAELSTQFEQAVDAYLQHCAKAEPRPRSL